MAVAGMNNAYPILSNVLMPVGITVAAWVFMPKLLRRLHDYIEKGSATILQHGGKVREHGVPYDLSLWCALEEPCRLFATFLFLSQLGTIVAPKTFAASYIKCLWNGGSVATLVWFLQRWKRNVLTRFLRTKSMSSSEKERYLALDQMSSFILLFIGALGIAEALGMAVQSLLTVGGIGGIATAIAARDVLGNFLSGVALIFAKPFSVGDLIQAGHVGGRVEEVGIHSTRLLNTEKNPISVPNSHFSSQVIVNRSRAPYRALVVKIPVHLKDFEKMTVTTGEIRSMLKNHPEVYMGEDKPRCSISRFSAMAMEIFISCNIKPMNNEDYYETEQDIMIQSARIITQSGAVLGGLL